MAKYLLILILIASAIGFGWFARDYWSTRSPEVQKIIPPTLKPLEKYSIENLSMTSVQPVEIEIGEVLKETPEFTSHIFSFKFDPSLQNKDKKKVTGLINIPETPGPHPLVVMFRGYADQKTYTAGVGTRRAGEAFAENGYITVAPDFLGYAGSDSEAGNIFESRFQTYTTTITLLKSISNIDGWDGKNVFIWAHSNGGQVALTTLEATSASYPTVLWAPVSKPFPYSVLYYTDESDDGGKLIRRELANFEDIYDTDLFSIHNYYYKIKAPIEIYQGTADDAVPHEWSYELDKKLRELGIDTNYLVYPGADHNLNPSWDTVVQRNLKFFNSHIED